MVTRNTRRSRTLTPKVLVLALLTSSTLVNTGCTGFEIMFCIQMAGQLLSTLGAATGKESFQKYGAIAGGIGSLGVGYHQFNGTAQFSPRKTAQNEGGLSGTDGTESAVNAKKPDPDATNKPTPDATNKPTPDATEKPNGDPGKSTPPKTVLVNGIPVQEGTIYTNENGNGISATCLSDPGSCQGPM